MAYPAPGASPQLARPTPPGQPLVRERPGNMLANCNPDDLPTTQKREGQDWYAVFNPEVQRVLDVELLHDLVHESVVCCVRFSRDGKYVATGCNRSAQIFDVATGQKIVTLQDGTIDKDGDLYIRSVRFSPDGKFLATGAEDNQIRVRLTYPRLGLVRFLVLSADRITFLRFGILLPVPSSTFSPDTMSTSIRLTTLEMVDISLPAAATRRCACGM